MILTNSSLEDILAAARTSNDLKRIIAAGCWFPKSQPWRFASSVVVKAMGGACMLLMNMLRVEEGRVMHTHALALRHSLSVELVQAASLLSPPFSQVSQCVSRAVSKRAPLHGLYLRQLSSLTSGILSQEGQIAGHDEGRGIRCST